MHAIALGHVAGLRCVEHGLHLIERHVQVAQAADDLRQRDLGHRVRPVAGHRVDLASGSRRPTSW